MTTAPRYYLYVADSKVDALLGQLSGAKKEQVSSQVGFNVGLVSGKIQASTNTLDDRVSRLSAAEQHLVAASVVGPVGANTAWIAGRHRARLITPKEHPGSVLFLIHVGDVTVLLGGSAGNLIGAPKTESTVTSYSFVPRILESLESVARLETLIRVSPESAAEILTAGVANGEQAWGGMVAQLERKTRSPLVAIKFVAKSLLQTVYEGRQMIIGSPLFVATAD